MPARVAIDQLIRDAIHPALKPRGFRRTGRNFRKTLAGVTQIVNVQASQWNSGDRGQFTLNLGVYYPAAAELHGIYSVKEQPLEPDCIVRMRIGRLLPDPGDHWWEVEPTTDCDRLKRELTAVLTDVAVPWLDVASTHAGALQYCVERQNFWWHAIFALLAGDPELAKSSLRTAVETAGRDDLRERLLNWGRKHGLAAA
jgi:hypothetical protein